MSKPAKALIFTGGALAISLILSGCTPTQEGANLNTTGNTTPESGATKDLTKPAGKTADGEERFEMIELDSAVGQAVLQEVDKLLTSIQNNETDLQDGGPLPQMEEAMQNGESININAYIGEVPFFSFIDFSGLEDDEAVLSMASSFILIAAYAQDEPTVEHFTDALKEPSIVQYSNTEAVLKLSVPEDSYLAGLEYLPMILTKHGWKVDAAEMYDMFVK